MLQSRPSFNKPKPIFIKCFFFLPKSLYNSMVLHIWRISMYKKNMAYFKFFIRFLFSFFKYALVSIFLISLIFLLIALRSMEFWLHTHKVFDHLCVSFTLWPNISQQLWYSMLVFRKDMWFFNIINTWSFCISISLYS